MAGQPPSDAFGRALPGPLTTAIPLEENRVFAAGVVVGLTHAGWPCDSCGACRWQVDRYVRAIECDVCAFAIDLSELAAGWLAHESRWPDE